MAGELLKRPAKTADFVIESFEPGYMASLGPGYDDLCQCQARDHHDLDNPLSGPAPAAIWRRQPLPSGQGGVYQEMLGFAEDEITDLVAEEAITTGADAVFRVP